VDVPRPDAITKLSAGAALVVGIKRATMLSIVICIIRSLTPVAVLSALGHLKGLLEGHAVVCIDRWYGCEEDRLLFLG
jgi:hypothetical protein